MSGLLLGTHGLKMLIAGDPVLADWLEAQGNASLHATFASIARLLSTVEQMSDVALRRQWIERLTEEVPADFGPRLHGFDLEAAKRWSAVRAEVPEKTKLVETDLHVIAVALAEDLDYVAPRLTWHEKIRDLKLHDPWQ